MTTKLYTFINENTDETFLYTKKDITNKTGFKDSLARVEQVILNNDKLYIVKPNTTIVYKKVHGSWGFPTKLK